MEHYLLYYDWDWCEEAGEPCAELTYCVSIGELPDAEAKGIAITHGIIYYEQSERSVLFDGSTQWADIRSQGFSPDDCSEEELEERDKPYYEMQSYSSHSKVPTVRWATAMVNFEEVSASGVPNEAVQFMQRIVKIAAKHREKFPSGGTIESTAKITSPEPPPTELKKKYEDIVESLLDLHIREMVEGKRTKLMTAKEMIPSIKKSDIFKGGKEPQNDSIVKGVRRTPAWKNRKTALDKAWKVAGLGESYNQRKRNDKRRKGKNMDSFQDVQ